MMINKAYMQVMRKFSMLFAVAICWCPASYALISTVNNAAEESNPPYEGEKPAISPQDFSLDATPAANNPLAIKTWYVCYKFLDNMMRGDHQMQRCDSFTGSCMLMNLPMGYRITGHAQCKIQQKPCEPDWQLYGRYDKNSSVNLVPSTFNRSIEYTSALMARQAYSRCISEPIVINKAP